MAGLGQIGIGPKTRRWAYFEQAEWLSLLAALFAIIGGLLVIVGWSAGIEILKRVAYIPFGHVGLGVVEPRENLELYSLTR